MTNKQYVQSKYPDAKLIRYIDSVFQVRYKVKMRNESITCYGKNPKEAWGNTYNAILEENSAKPYFK